MNTIRFLTQFFSKIRFKLYFLFFVMDQFEQMCITTAITKQVLNYYTDNKININ